MTNRSTAQILNEERPLADLMKSLEECLEASPAVAVAVSGGVDSMTLAHAALKIMGTGVAMFHAVSPAVPEAATERVRAHAKAAGWQLEILDAGEFSDENYRKNPANRCFFCKSNLYAALSRITERQIFSGTNTDDLADFRPGLSAAENHAVRHPFVEAGFAKRDVRRLARHLGLADLSELPSAPCLSSRVETGLRIEPAALRFIDAVETMLRERLRPETVRCRLRANGIMIELDAASLAALSDEDRADLADLVLGHADTIAAQPVVFAAYRMGSAFLRERLDER